MVKVTIDGKVCEAKAGSSILETAKANNITIPTLCYLKEINEIGACRICLVEVEGKDHLVASCKEKVEEGMVIYTNSFKVRRAKRTNLYLILSQHDAHCLTCVRNTNCELQKLCSEMNVLREPYPYHSINEPINDQAPIIRNNNKCIKCMRCIQICDKIQNMHIWDIIGTGSRTTIGTVGNVDITQTDCTYCGQCVTHCPVGALSARDDTYKVFEKIGDPNTVTVCQVAPAVRAAWGEYLGMEREEATMKKMVAALKEMGFDYVFDTNFTADLTIMEEGSEFLERFTHKDQYPWPMFTSCCPGWVRFIKSQYPEYVKNLSTAKSPQQMFGAVTKSYFAEKLGIDPHHLFLVSVMPCSSKKSECALPNMNDGCGDPDVDLVITTRELVRMIKSEHIDLKNLPEADPDSPLGTGTGAAVIFGATGGVMDAALRSAYYLVTGNNPDPDSFKSVRGMKGWKEAIFNIPGAGEIKVAVASGLGNTRKLMEAIDHHEVDYDFVEIMACPGGCAGGGGQPIHAGEEMAEVRGNELWRLDQNEPIRFSHENPDVLTLYKEYLEQPLSKKAHHLLHTDHSAWKMPKEE